MKNVLEEQRLKIIKNIFFTSSFILHFFSFLQFSTCLWKDYERGGVLAEQRRVAKYCGGKICQQAVLSPIRQVYSSVTALNSPLITKSHLFRPFMPLKATPSIFGQSCVDQCVKFCFVTLYYQKMSTRDMMGEEEWLLVAQVDLDLPQNPFLKKITADYCNGFLPCVGQTSI